MYADMEQWAEIRRRVLTDEISKREACRQYGIHWLTLKKILSHEEPPGYRRSKPPRASKIDPVLPVIRQILADDAKAPKKQRHTAHRIWQRLRDEHAFAPATADGRRPVPRPVRHQWSSPRKVDSA